MSEARREGAVILPIVGIDQNVLYFMMIPPREEDSSKRVETLIGSDAGLRPVRGSGLPGGAREQGQTVLDAAIEEWSQETSGNGLGGVNINNIEGRLTPALEAVAAYQERPKPTDFDVTMYLLLLDDSEKDEMLLRGCELAMLDLTSGHIYQARDGSDVDFRPIHADLLTYLAMISGGLSNMVEESSYATVNTN